MRNCVDSCTAGYIIPPAPDTPDFRAEQERLGRLGGPDSGEFTREEQRQRFLENEIHKTTLVQFSNIHLTR